MSALIHGLPRTLGVRGDSALLQTLAGLAEQRYIRQLDYQFARFVAEHDPNPVVVLAAAVTSYQLGQGHVCLNLSDVGQKPLFELEWRDHETLLGETHSRTDDWTAILHGSQVVNSAGSPLVLDAGRLYLRRFYEYEVRIATALRTAAADSQQPALRDSLQHLFAREYGFIFAQLLKWRKQASAVFSLTRAQAFVSKFLDLALDEQGMPLVALDWPAIQHCLQQASSAAELQVLDQWIPEHACLNWQKVAAAVAASRRFAVISGGPGTGKTTTVTKLLALLVEQRLSGPMAHLPLNIKLVAPTGKAAARLTESIGGAKAQLPLSAKVAEQIPEQASTIHRLLGVVPHRLQFRHNQDNPLHLDLLVVDEASMVDVPLMASLLQALPPKARLILLGDKDQLASVEAGSVLGDICSFAEQGYSADQAEWLTQVTGYDFQQYTCVEPDNRSGNSLCLLRKSYRFDADSGIGHLARAVNQGQMTRVAAIWQQAFQDIHLHLLGEESYTTLLQLAVSGYRDYLTQLAPISDEQEARPIIDAFNRFQILVALREGDFGVSGLNQRIETALVRQRLIRRTDSEWYAGRPVMITCNDHGLGLYNGDIGITLPSVETDPEGRVFSRFRVYFLMPDGHIRAFLPSRLPAHQTVFAMTIHKSQGSEFEHTVMVLPPEHNPVLTRELVYTGITRAKSRLEIFTNPQVMAKAVQRRTERASGLAWRLA